MAGTIKDILGIARTKKYRAKNRHAFTVSSNGFHGIAPGSKPELVRKKKKNWKLALAISKPLKEMKF